ncbi:MAG: hypothetical protein ABI164_02875 [Acidobacteriaceae bacterium]
MKFAIRALVLGMLITGFAADHMLATKAASTTASTTMTASTAGPIPMCRLGTSCGMGRW